MTTYARDPAAIPDIEQTRWRIDPTRSRLEFHARTFWGLSTVKGRFERYDGTLDLCANPAIELAIDADSINTNHEKRDKHLRSADFFDVGNHPQVRFISDSVRVEGEHLKVRGQLFAAGESLPLDLDALLRRAGDGLEVDVSTYADHRQLGITFSPLGMLRTPSKLIVRGRLVQDAK